jgi:hypothetical protein
LALRIYGFNSVFSRFDHQLRGSSGGHSVAVRKNMIKHITIGVAALAFGVAFASVPAFAQTHYGRALNDGGMADDYSSATPARPLYNSATPAVPTTPHYGRALNDGGMADDYSSAGQPVAKTQSKIVQQQTPPRYGRPMNDGGF